jgi:hypothetical protein
MSALEGFVRQSGIEHALLHLVKMRASMAVVAINGWNRIAIAFRAVPGTNQSRAPRPPRDLEQTSVDRTEAGRGMQRIPHARRAHPAHLSTAPHPPPLRPLPRAVRAEARRVTS